MSGEMRREVNEIKDSVASISAAVSRIDTTLNRVMVAVAQLTGTVTEMKADMATKKDISDLNGRMDGFAGVLLDSRHRWAVHAETLSSHDERLKKLESRPS